MRIYTFEKSVKLLRYINKMYNNVYKRLLTQNEQYLINKVQETIDIADKLFETLNKLQIIN